MSEYPSIQLAGVDKKIIFTTDDETITNLFIVALENNGYTSYQIKFSIKVNPQFDAWYLIPSINPLKVFGGSAGTFVPCNECIICNEYEVINFIMSKTPNDLHKIAGQSKTVRTYSDYYETK